MAFKKKPDEPKKGAPEYMNTYGDMITLMLTFFVLLFAMSNLDEQKFTAMQESYSRAALSIISGGLGDIFSSQGPSIVNQQSPAAEEPADDEVSDEATDAANATEASDAESTAAPTTEPATVSAADAAQLEEIRVLEAAMTGMASDFKTYLAQNAMTSNIEITVPETYEYVLFSFPDGMLYASGQAVLLPGAVETLDIVLDKLVEYSGHVIRIEGHTDNVPQVRPPFNNNWLLSSARAVAVAQYMTATRGFDPRKVQPVGMGEYWPVDTNDTPEGRARNRRVEIKVYAQEATAVGGGARARYPWE